MRFLPYRHWEGIKPKIKRGQNRLSDINTFEIENQLIIVHVLWTYTIFSYFCMRVNFFNKSTIEDFAKENAGSERSFKLWLIKLKSADWEKPGDMMSTFPSADLLGNGSNRVVFDIGGNNYRMICKYWFGKGRISLFVKWIGTHAQYDALCKKNKQYIAEDY